MSEREDLVARSDALAHDLGSDASLEVNAAILDLDPGHPVATNRLGIGLLNQGRATEARAVLEAGVRIHPHNAIMRRRLEEAEKMLAGVIAPASPSRRTGGTASAPVGWTDFVVSDLVEGSLAGPGRDACLRLCAASIVASERIDAQRTAVTPIKDGRRFRTIGGIFTGVGPWRHTLTVAVPIASRRVIAAVEAVGGIVFEPAKAVPCVQVAVPRAEVPSLYDRLLDAHSEHLPLSIAAGPPTHLSKHHPRLRSYILEHGNA